MLPVRPWRLTGRWGSESKYPRFVGVRQYINAAHAAARPEDLKLRARMSTFATAAGKMQEAPEALDLSGESDATHHAYGVRPGDQKSFAWQCLIARRFLERGVRVVELIDTGSHDNWDAHGDMAIHRPKAQRVNRSPHCSATSSSAAFSNKLPSPPAPNSAARRGRMVLMERAEIIMQKRSPHCWPGRVCGAV